MLVLGETSEAADRLSLIDVCGRDLAHRPVRSGQFPLSTWFVAPIGINGSQTSSWSCESSVSEGRCHSCADGSDGCAWAERAHPGALFTSVSSNPRISSPREVLLSPVYRRGRHTFPCMVLHCLLAQYGQRLAKDSGWSPTGGDVAWPRSVRTGS